jgi:hypothetical protein
LGDNDFGFIFFKTLLPETKEEIQSKGYYMKCVKCETELLASENYCHKCGYKMLIPRSPNEIKIEIERLTSNLPDSIPKLVIMMAIITAFEWCLGKCNSPVDSIIRIKNKV